MQRAIWQSWSAAWLLAASSHAAGLPAAWEGAWSGTFDMISDTQNHRDVAMALEIRPLGTRPGHTWHLTYGAGPQAQLRPYELVPQADRKDAFLLNEKNGIVIDFRRLGDVLYGQFEVGESRVTSRFRLVDDRIEVELATFEAKAARTSHEAIGKHEVRSYRLKALQRGVLQRRTQPVGRLPHPRYNRSVPLDRRVSTVR